MEEVVPKKEFRRRKEDEEEDSEEEDVRSTAMEVDSGVVALPFLACFTRAVFLLRFRPEIRRSGKNLMCMEWMHRFPQFEAASSSAAASAAKKSDEAKKEDKKRKERERKARRAAEKAADSSNPKPNPKPDPTPSPAPGVASVGRAQGEGAVKVKGGAEGVVFLTAFLFGPSLK
jgi:hypothetical protein